MLQHADLVRHLDQLDDWGVRDRPANVREAVERARQLREHRAQTGEPLTAIQARLAEQIVAAEIEIPAAVKELAKHRRAAEDAEAADALLRIAQREAERRAVEAFRSSGPELLALLRETFASARERFEAGDDAALATLERVWDFLDLMVTARVIRTPAARDGTERRWARPELVPLDRTLSPAQRMREAIASGAEPGIFNGSQIRRNEVTGSLPRRPRMISA